MARPLFRRGSQAGSVYMDCEEAFKLIDKNGDGVLSRIEVIQACRTDARVAKLLRLPQRIHQEDGSRDRFEEIFQMMDEDDSKEVDLQEFQKFWVTHVLPHLWVEVTATPDPMSDNADAAWVAAVSRRRPYGYMEGTAARDGLRYNVRVPTVVVRAGCRSS